MWAKLCLLNKEKEVTYDLTSDKLTIGRSPKSSIVIADPRVSSTHAIIKKINRPTEMYVKDTSTNGTWLNKKKLLKNRWIVLNELESKLLVANPKNDDGNKICFVLKWLRNDSSSDVSRHGWLDNYVLGRTLGNGAFATVREATQKTTGRKFAMKIVEKKRFALVQFSTKKNSSAPRNNNCSEIMREVNILRKCEHPNIVKCYDVFDTPTRLHIVLELVNGGELFEYLVDSGPIPEAFAQIIFRQLCSAVSYLHSNGISHRDLKPENILLVKAPSDSLSSADIVVKLSDFGMSRLVTDGSFMQTMAGTPHYLAPEILLNGGADGRGYGKEVDLWSLGVVLYVLLFSQMPFGDTNMSVFDQIRSCVFSFPSTESVSSDAINLVKRLIVKDPSKRLSARGALVHPWVAGAGTRSLAPLETAVRVWKRRQLHGAAKRWKAAVRDRPSQKRSCSPATGKRVNTKKKKRTGSPGAKPRRSKRRLGNKRAI